MAKKDCAKAINTFAEFEFADGEKVPVTINFHLLNKLRRQHSKSLYKEFGRIAMKGSDDIDDMLSVVYIGYLCAYFAGNGDFDGAMSREAFYERCPSGVGYVMAVASELIDPNGRGASVKSSSMGAEDSEE